MVGGSIIDMRVRSVLPLVLFFAYVLAFVFEGPAFYSMAQLYGVDPIDYVMIAVLGMFAGLLVGGLTVKGGRMAKRFMLLGMTLCFLLTGVFFLPPSWLWMAAIALCAFFGGVVNASWGHFLHTYTPVGQRIKSCADVLIFSNALMIPINIVSIHFSFFVGLAVALALILAAMFCLVTLPSEGGVEASDARKGQPSQGVGALTSQTVAGIRGEQSSSGTAEKPTISHIGPMVVLIVFVTLLTINSGLMYRMIVPAFSHLTTLTSWYWAVPYIVAALIMRNLRVERSGALYLGMGMIVAAFIFFLTLGRDSLSYLVVDTLMLGAFGIFDLFWWSIFGEMLGMSKRPARVFGLGLAANVLGILFGNLIALTMDALMLPVSGTTIVALAVVCITLMLLPPLNHRLTMLLKNHAYLTAFSAMPGIEQSEVMHVTPPVESLTPREHEVLTCILNGKTNRAIAEELTLSENTIKTHIRNILRKYQVSSRFELISIFLNAPIERTTL